MEKNILAQFINNTPHFIWWKDLDGVFMGCNNNLLEYAGLKSKDEIIGKTDHDFWDKEEADFFRKIDEKIIATGKPQLNFEECMTLPDQGKRWLSTSKIPMYDDENNIIGTIGWFDDITKRKQLEEEVLKAKEDRYKMLFDSMSEMVTILELVYDSKGKPIDYYIRDINLAAANFYGKPKGDLIDKKITEIVGTIEDYWLKTFSDVDKTAMPTPFEYYGKEYDKYYAGTAWKVDASKVGVTYIDITEQKRIQELKDKTKTKLERIGNELNEAQKLAKVGSWLFNPSNQEYEWSDEMFHIWGFAGMDIIPSYKKVIKRIHPDDFALYTKSVGNASTQGAPYDIEFRICIPDEEQKTIRSICKPYLDVDGAVTKLTGTNQDISAQKKFEEAQAKDQRLKAVGEMSSSIAHDFNNALQEMMGNLEVVKLQSGLSDETKDRLNNIGTTISDVAGRVSALQNFGDTGHEIAKSAALNLNSLIADSLKQSRPLWKDSMEKQGLHIAVTADLEDIPKIRCNPGELKAAFHNLIKNSVEAMPNGGSLTIQTGTKDDVVYATFQDSGIGMSEETKLKVFQPFYSTKGLELGRGLGMSGVYSTIKKYGGEITVLSSELNKGTTFEIVFPISTKDEVKVANPIITNDKQAINVLWVDDDILITDTVSELVNSFGHTCSIANNGIKALEFLDRNNCDIVFTDIGMPGMTGWELADAIREKYGSTIKIVVVSGWDITDDDKVKHRIDSVLQKPFLLEDLEKKLQLV